MERLSLKAGYFVGRVGGLAVALGVGAAVSLGAPVAWADDTADANSSESSPPSDGSATSDSSASPASGSAEGTTSQPDASPSSSSPKSDEQPDVEKAPKRRPSHKKRDVSSKADRAGRESRSEEADSESSRSSRRSSTAPKQTDAPAGTVDTEPTPTKAVVVNAEPEPASAKQVAVSESVQVASPAIASVPRGLLSLLGGDFGGSAGSPVAWVFAAAARRELTGADTGAAETSSRQTTAQTFALAAAVANQAPVIGKVTVGSPGFFSSAVTGKVTATDPDKNTLKFSVPTTSTKGAAVKINSTTGSFTYTPTAAVRHAASLLGDPTAKTDSFVVTVSDGQGGTASTTVTVPVSPTNKKPTVAYTPTVNAANTATGVVTGTLKAADADGDTLSFTAAPAKGTIVFGAGGSFTYTPSDSARRAASAPGASSTVKSDSFTVTVSDNHGGTVTKTLKVPVSPAPNAAPVITSLSAGDPVVSSGLVLGGAIATDADHDTLVYSATATAKGKVNINSSTGEFNYTPTAAARTAATGSGATPTDKQDTVTVTVTDGHGGTASKSISVAIAPAVAGTNVTKIGDVAIAGTSWGETLTSADGTRALATTYTTSNGTFTTRVAVVNTTTGKQNGTTFTLTGSPSGSALSADGSRAVVSASATDATGTTTRVAVIDTATGVQVGATLTLNGTSSGSVITANGTRAVITTEAPNTPGGATTTRVTVINTATGAQTGTTTTFTGAWGSKVLSADGSRALVTAYTQDTAFTTRVAMINTATGTQIGTTLTLAGYGTGTFSADGTRALMTSSTTGAGGDATLVTSINTVSGAQVGSTVTLAGNAQTAIPLNASSNRVLIATLLGDSTNGFDTRVAVVDATTGAQIGAIEAVGQPSIGGGPLLSADGTRALISTVDYTAAGWTTYVSVLDTTTGARVGMPIILTGEAMDSKLLAADGSRALITTNIYDSRTSTSTSRAAVYNTTTGAQIGTALVVQGTQLAGYAPLLAADGSRALVTAEYSDFGSNVYSTRVGAISTAGQPGAILTLAGRPSGSALLSPDGVYALTVTNGNRVALINTATGTQIGTLTLSGGASGAPRLTPDRSRVLFTTSTYNWLTGAETTHLEVLRTV